MGRAGSVMLVSLGAFAHADQGLSVRGSSCPWPLAATLSRRESQVVAFVYDFLDVLLPFDAAAAALLRAEPDWLASMATHGAEAGGELQLRLAPPGSPLPLPSKRGRVDVESPYRRGDAWVLPFHWRPTGAAVLFPQIEAELQVAPLGPSEVRLTFTGHYRPPFGEVGHLADTVLMHRVVERSARVFLGSLARGLETVGDSRETSISRA